jgi:GDP-L-fucose synthase
MRSGSRAKVLVCGASGFIGRNMAERLAGREDLEVFGTVHSAPGPRDSRIRLLEADLRDPAHVRRALSGMDVVIQAAATTSGSKDIVGSPQIHVTDNAVMNSLIFREAHELGIGHVVFFSCSVMYPSQDSPVREEDFDPARIHEKYFGVAWTKVYLERMAEFYSRLGRTRYTVLRHSNVYGPHDKFDLERSHVFGATVAKVMKATDGRVAVWGDGTEGRDLLYIDDLTRFVELSIDRQKDPMSLVNVGSGEAVTVRSLVERVIAASGRDLRIEFDRTKATIPTTVRLDITRARETVGWEPQVSLDEGIARTLRWHRENARG